MEGQMPLKNFYQLYNSIREKAIRDPEHKRSQSQLAKWQKLLTIIVETELAMQRVRNALNSLKTIPSKETLDKLSMSEGAWIDYHYTTWAFLMSSLLDKEIELVSQVGQKLIKPNNPKHKDIVRPLIESLVSLKDKVGKIRHPLAHKGEGGTIEAVMKTDTWKSFAIMPSPINFDNILVSYVPYHLRWHHFLNGASVKIMSQIEHICKEIYTHIDWENV
jgi:hypothetical protein